MEVGVCVVVVVEVVAMGIERQDNRTVIRTGNAELTLDADSPLTARLSFGGNRVADLIVPSSCNANHLPDFSFDLSPATVRQDGDEVLVEFTSRSSLWEKKTYCFKASSRGIEYFYVVEGRGKIDNCEFFQGFVGAPRKPASAAVWEHGRPENGHWGRMRSKSYFKHLFNPEPNGLRKHYFQTNEFTTIGVRSDKGYCRGNWFYTPGPFCFVAKIGDGGHGRADSCPVLQKSPDYACAKLDTDGARNVVQGLVPCSSTPSRGQAPALHASPRPPGVFDLCSLDPTGVRPSGGSPGWLTFGLGVNPGEHTFTQYDCSGGDGFGLVLRYEGRTEVQGRWESPHIILVGADDHLSALAAYCRRVREMEYAGLAPNRAFPWWQEPIFCGWGEQCHLQNTGRPRARAAELATQSNYERFLEALAHQGISPGTVVIDDKWQLTYGSCAPDGAKWPDMAGFIREQHRVGRRVLLWFKAWDPEGVPADECILDNLDRPLSVDPSNPAYEARLRRQVAFALGNLDADGFKLDFTHLHPPASSRPTFGNLWGVELLKRLLWIIDDEAKRVKPDAMIIAHTANPYFVDVVDALRLNDVAIIDGDDSYTESMVHRQRVARAACPELLVDTDNWPSPNVAAWLEYVREQPQLGIPSLYYATHVCESGEEMDATCYAAIREAWAGYRESLEREFAEGEVKG